MKSSRRKMITKIKLAKLTNGKETEELTAIVEQWEASNGEIPIR